MRDSTSSIDRMPVAGTSWAAALIVTSSVAAVDGWATQGLERGRLHEVFALEEGDAGCAAGFVVAQAVVAAALPLLWLRTEASERIDGPLHAAGLAGIGLDVVTLVLGVVPDERALLRAAADAARCPGLGTLVVEARGRAPEIDLTATRRLMLAAEASGVTVVMLRIAASPSPTAAATRWGVSAAPSTALEADAPGLPAFDLELLRRRGGPAGARWRVEWQCDDRRFAIAPIFGAGVSLARDRIAQVAPPASVRRTG